MVRVVSTPSAAAVPAAAKASQPASVSRSRRKYCYELRARSAA
jgi:hypothetical protein